MEHAWKEKFSQSSLSLQIQDFLANKSSAEELSLKNSSNIPIERKQPSSFALPISETSRNLFSRLKVSLPRERCWKKGRSSFSIIVRSAKKEKKKNQWTLFSFLLVSRRSSFSSESALDGSMFGQPSVKRIERGETTEWLIGRDYGHSSSEIHKLRRSPNWLDHRAKERVLESNVTLLSSPIETNSYIWCWIRES